MSIRPLALRGLVAMLVLATSIVGVEAVLRLWTPHRVEAFAAGRPIAGENTVLGQAYTVDDVLGYRPVLGGIEYGLQGALHNDYALEKPAGTRRLLFLGDSVTHRAKIQQGFRAELGDAGFEYWSAGVDGYTTAQEVEYYRRYCAPLRADRVVLTFHLNDFESTPVVFRDGEKLTRIYTSASSRELNPWLLRHSLLYRWYQSSTLREEPAAERETPPAGPEIERALRELGEEVTRSGGKLAVIVLPWLRPHEKWRVGLQRKRVWVLATLARLGIEHYDFLPTLEEALAEGVEVMENPRDPQHPSAEFGRRMARSMLAAGFEP